MGGVSQRKPQPAQQPAQRPKQTVPESIKAAIAANNRSEDKKVWLRAWCATAPAVLALSAGPSQNDRRKVTAEWAARALEDYRERWPR